MYRSTAHPTLQLYKWTDGSAIINYFPEVPGMLLQEHIVRVEYRIPTNHSVDPEFGTRALPKDELSCGHGFAKHFALRLGIYLGQQIEDYRSITFVSVHGPWDEILIRALTEAVSKLR
jgi:hypothetical protein